MGDYAHDAASARWGGPMKKYAPVIVIAVTVAAAVVGWFIPRLLPEAVFVFAAACVAAQWWGLGETPPARREAIVPAILLAGAAILYLVDLAGWFEISDWALQISLVGLFFYALFSWFSVLWPVLRSWWRR